MSTENRPNAITSGIVQLVSALAAIEQVSTDPSAVAIASDALSKASEAPEFAIIVEKIRVSIKAKM
jgi:hypothetical protein